MDEHLQRFEGGQAAALQRTREAVRSALPGAEEVISYAMPTFKISGVAIIGYDGFAKHNSLFPYSSGVVAMVAEQLPDATTTKGSIHFPRDEPFPTVLLRRILRMRIDEVNAGYPKKSGQFLQFYDNGRLKNRGRMKAGQMHGDWEWFRRDGSLMRTGSFRNGDRTGRWVTYDRDGRLVRTVEVGR